MHAGIYVHNGFLIVAIVFFVLDGIKAVSPAVSWTPLGFASVVAAFVFPFFV
jgi:hypothetical protein